MRSPPCLHVGAGWCADGDLGRWLSSSGPNFPPLEDDSMELSPQFAGADPGPLGGLRVSFLGPSDPGAPGQGLAALL